MSFAPGIAVKSATAFDKVPHNKTPNARHGNYSACWGRP